VGLWLGEQGWGSGTVDETVNAGNLVNGGRAVENDRKRVNRANIRGIGCGGSRLSDGGKKKRSGFGGVQRVRRFVGLVGSVDMGLESR